MRNITTSIPLTQIIESHVLRVGNRPTEARIRGAVLGALNARYPALRLQLNDVSARIQDVAGKPPHVQIIVDIPNDLDFGAGQIKAAIL